MIRLTHRHVHNSIYVPQQNELKNYNGIEQIMNIVLRRCLALLDHKLIRRDYFDKGAAQDIPVFEHFIFGKLLMMYIHCFLGS